MFDSDSIHKQTKKNGKKTGFQFTKKLRSKLGDIECVFPLTPLV